MYQFGFWCGNKSQNGKPRFKLLVEGWETHPNWRLPDGLSWTYTSLPWKSKAFLTMKKEIKWFFLSFSLLFLCFWPIKLLLGGNSRSFWFLFERLPKEKESELRFSVECGWAFSNMDILFLDYQERL